MDVPATAVPLEKLQIRYEDTVAVAAGEDGVSVGEVD